MLSIYFWASPWLPLRTYVINLKLEQRVHSTVQLEAVIIWFAVSALLGCIATVSKLLDYRYTAKKIKDGGRFNALMARHCGNVTWCCFWGQLISYAVGAYLFIKGIIAT